MSASTITANGQPLVAKLPCTIEEFLVAQGWLPRNMVMEHTPLPKLAGKASLYP